MFARLANLAHFRPKLVVLVALAIAAVAALLGSSVAERLDPLGFGDPNSESSRASAVLEHEGWRDVDLVVLVDADSRIPAATVASEIRREPLVAQVSAKPRSADGSAYVMAAFRPVSDKQKQTAAERVEKRIGDRPGVAVGGPAASNGQLNTVLRHDLQRAEIAVFPLLFVLSLLLFRSLVAAALPLVVGGLSIVMTELALSVISEFMGVSVMALNLVTALGLGLAIDYSLFMVARYREELERHGPGLAALRATLGTAGRTVLFSAMTVAAAMASLLIFPQQFLYSIGIGGVLVSTLAAATTLLVLPAVLALLGRRVNALAPAWLKRRSARDAQPVTAGMWYRLASFVMRRPAAVALVTGVVLVVMALPFFGVRLTSVDASVLPQSTGARQVHEALEADGALNGATPVVVLMRGADQGEANAFARHLGALPGAAGASPVTRLPSGDHVAQVTPKAPAFSSTGQDLVKEVRAAPAGFDVSVTGATAEFVDLKASMRSHLPLAAAVIIASTLLVLFLMTGSIVLGVKALVMNVLTVGAVFGALVVTFQDGRLQSLLGYTSQGALESTMPLILFAVVFGLSTDYGVFLLARVKEARDDGAPDWQAVATGQAQTGRLITSAALLFFVTIAAFSTSRIVGMKEMTTGIALGVALDATLIRVLLVPALMQLLGRWNWWAPRPLAWLHGRVGVSESASPSPVVASAPPAR